MFPKLPAVPSRGAPVPPSIVIPVRSTISPWGGWPRPGWDEVPEGWAPVAAALMELIAMVALHRASLGLYPGWLPFDLRHPFSATAENLTIAIRWLEEIWLHDAYSLVVVPGIGTDPNLVPLNATSLHIAAIAPAPSSDKPSSYHSSSRFTLRLDHIAPGPNGQYDGDRIALCLLEGAVAPDHAEPWHAYLCVADIIDGQPVWAEFQLTYWPGSLGQAFGFGTDSSYADSVPLCDRWRYFEARIEDGYGVLYMNGVEITRVTAATTAAAYPPGVRIFVSAMSEFKLSPYGHVEDYRHLYVDVVHSRYRLLSDGSPAAWYIDPASVPPASFTNGGYYVAEESTAQYVTGTLDLEDVKGPGEQVEIVEHEYPRIPHGPLQVPDLEPESFAAVERWIELVRPVIVQHVGAV